MRLLNSPVRRTALALAIPLIGVGALLTPSIADAEPNPLLAVDAPDAVALSSTLGTRSAGTYLDESGRMVVTVTDEKAADTVEAAGALSKMVTYGADKLDAVEADLTQTASISGTAWATNPADNQVVVVADETVSAADLAKVQAAVDRAGGAARLERATGEFTTKIAGGEAIFGGAYRCSLGFNVSDGTNSYFLTAGHCTNVADAWFSDLDHTTTLGTVIGGSFPGDDYGIVQYASAAAHPSSVFLYEGSQNITSAGTAVVGQAVQRSGSTTGLHNGTVLEVDATVNYPEGPVSGLIRTDVCAEGGDSGGSLFSGTVALGLTSGGSGDCNTGGTTYFQPVTEVLATYGVTLP